VGNLLKDKNRVSFDHQIHGDQKMTMSNESVEKLIENTTVSIISSVDEYGFPNTKAMLPPRKRDGLKDFYFTTNTSSMRVNQYKATNKACIYFFDNQFFHGVMLIGKMEVLTDQKTKERIWRDGDTMYYPLGVTDPDYCVLKFTAEKMRIYQNFKSETIDV
jgi:general stress protein 26